VALISDAEMQATADMTAKFKDPKGPAAGWGIGFANSMRSMLRAPELAQAWMAYGAAMRGEMKISRELQLQISFAVSTANGCRYCTCRRMIRRSPRRS
jgi:alkylhydroperoxidase/carboxymuconolactone decarboxylase family protein YurZ